MKPAGRRAGALHTAAVRATQREELRLVDGLDLTLTQFKVMHLLDSADGELSTSELAHQLGLPAGTTSGVVDALVRAGFVDRREGDGDRRVKSTSWSVVKRPGHRLAHRPLGLGAVAVMPVVARFSDRLSARATGPTDRKESCHGDRRP